MTLKDEVLEKVTGGFTDSEIIENINKLYGKLPEEIRNAIIDALNKKGRKAAKAVASKLLNNSYDWAKPIIDMFN